MLKPVLFSEAGWGCISIYHRNIYGFDFSEFIASPYCFDLATC